jgi:glycine/D-amino acid oxidase-like deaminating enzyme
VRTVPKRYGDLSLWHETCGDDLTSRPGLTSSVDVDVAIVGAGFTGLWTAYYLLRADPTLRVTVLERETAGFGASGRNGGWLSALFPASDSKLAALSGSSAESARRMSLAMRDTIGEVAAVITDESIDCHFHRGGTISFARSKSQLARARGEVEASREWGDTDKDLTLLTAEESATFARASDVLGATYTPHCARIHPARLARGLAHAVERHGGTIYEQTQVESIAPSLVTTAAGQVRASAVIRATEGFTPSLQGLRREVVPVYSLIVATEPLPDSVWDEIGLADSPTFTDYRHLIIYGQRTADGRIVFGGRGAPYHFGSAVRPAFDRKARVFADLRETLVDLFPALDGHAFTHEWGGPLGIARDWMASVGFDPATGIGWAGGYVGDGVSTTNLAGRTLADLVTGRETDLTTLPWVNHHSPRWEPEPLRWLGINAGLRGMTIADHEESLTGRQSLVARALAPLLGSH